MADNENGYKHTEVSGAINQHTPPYWRLALPALGARYVGRYAQKFFGFKDHRFFDAIAGGWMLGITAFFANRTRQDMLSIFSETVAYELNKDPSQVVFSDLMKSDNKAIITARTNFMRYNTARALVNSTFFASFLPGKFRAVEAVDLGVGANGAYLVTEILGRGRTFFEQLQSFVDLKLNQEKALGETIKPIELIHLFERNAIDNDPNNAFRGQVEGRTWKQSQVIFERMADLMNKTYQHRHDAEKENFTLPQFLYLLGHNLINPRNVPQTLALIEVSNSYGVSALKQVVSSLKQGHNLDEALKAYPVSLPEIIESPQVDRSGRFAGKETTGQSFVDKLGSKTASPDAGLAMLN